MRNVKVKITDQMIRRLVAEELRYMMSEDVDHEGVKTVVTAAGKLLKAIKDYEGAANAQLANAFVDVLPAMKQKLEDMLSSPMSYVDRPKQQQKVVKLRKVNDD